MRSTFLLQQAKATIHDDKRNDDVADEAFLLYVHMNADILPNDDVPQKKPSHSVVDSSVPESFAEQCFVTSLKSL